MHGHGFDGVDLLGHPHRAELCGGARADGGRQRDACDHGGDDADIEEGRQEAGQRLDADVAQRRVALDGDDTAGGQGQEGGDADGAADHHQRPGAHRHLGDEPDGLLAVAGERVRDVAERLAVEQRLLTDGVDGAWHPRKARRRRSSERRNSSAQRTSTRTPMAVMMTLMTKRQMNA